MRILRRDLQSIAGIEGRTDQVMPISYSEPAQLTCPNCGADFSAEVWLILDAQEQPDQAEALRQGALNTVTCPACGNTGPAGAPLLFHDRATRQVIFAASPGAAEHEWREQARELHGLLVGSIALEERRSYLSDVQIAQDIAGIAHLLAKRARQRGGREPPQPAPPPPVASAPAEETPPLLAAVQALIAADTPAELEAVVAAHPLLLEPGTDAALAQLAEVAVEQREHEIAESLSQARYLLTQIRLSGMTALEQPAAPAAELPAPAAPAAADLPDPAYQALLQAEDNAALLRTVETHPLLLEPWVAGWLARAADQALDEGHERLAQTLEERREQLAQLVASGPQDPAARDAQLDTLNAAVEALLIAEDEDAMAQALDAYPVLLTDAAQQALWQFAAEARASGDEDLGQYALECRAMLRKVREGLEE